MLRGTAAALRQRAGVGSRRRPPLPCLRHPRTLPGVQGAQLNKLVYCTARHLPTPKPVTKQQTQASFFGEKTTHTTLTHAHAQNMAGGRGRRRKEGEGSGEEDWRQVSVPQGRSVPFQASPPPPLPVLSPPASAARGASFISGILAATPLVHWLLSPYPARPRMTTAPRMGVPVGMSAAAEAPRARISPAREPTLRASGPRQWAALRPSRPSRASCTGQR